jgi:hypothetical protein
MDFRKALVAVGQLSEEEVEIGSENGKYFAKSFVNGKMKSVDDPNSPTNAITFKAIWSLLTAEEKKRLGKYDIDKMDIQYGTKGTHPSNATINFEDGGSKIITGAAIEKRIAELRKLK